MEIWKDVEGYEGLYSVSNYGRVKGHFGKILKPKYQRQGYLQVHLYKDKKQKTVFIHRLVAIAFIPNPDNLPQINHKDEIKDNNHVDNLEWCDGKYNCNYGTRNKRMSETLRLGSATIIQLTKNGEFIKEWESVKAASEALKIEKSGIYYCLEGKYKRNLSHGFQWQYKKAL